MNILGIADTAIRESKERVKAAIRNSGFKWPAERITVSLAPSDMRKEGASFAEEHIAKAVQYRSMDMRI